MVSVLATNLMDREYPNHKEVEETFRRKKSNRFDDSAIS